MFENLETELWSEGREEGEFRKQCESVLLLCAAHCVCWSRRGVGISTAGCKDRLTTCIVLWLEARY